MERTQQENHVLVAKVRRLLDQNRQLRETVQTLVAAHTMTVQEQDSEILRLIHFTESLQRENHQLRIATEARETREGGAQ